MTTAADIIAKGHTAMAELANRPRKPPQTGEEAPRHRGDAPPHQVQSRPHQNG